jgi:hypothetical protein
MKDNIKTWLLRVADGVEKWPLISRDAMDRARIIATATAAAVLFSEWVALVRALKTSWLKPETA